MTSDSGIRWRFNARAAPRVVALVGFVLVLPSLGNGLQIFDDVPQRDFIVAKLTGQRWATARPWYDAFSLVSGDPEAASHARYFWATPWWTWPGLKVQFFRPVAVATLYLDYGLFGEHLWLAHLHTALWYLVACWLVCRLTLKISRSSTAAVLGALLFAIDDAHASPVGWLAGRNAVIGVACVAGSLNLYVTASHRAQLRWAFLAAAALLVGLLAAENVSSTLMFFAAYTLLLDRRPGQRKWMDLAVVLVTAASWFSVHKLMGFGSFGSGAYLDPIRDGGAFWRALPARVWTLLELQFAGPWALRTYLPEVTFVHLAFFERFVVLPSLALFILRNRDREIAFWTLSGLVGLVPLAASAPHDRLLTHVGIAWWMVFAHMVVTLLRASASYVPTAARRALAASIILLYAVLSPCALAIGARVQEETVEIDTSALASTPDWWTRAVIAINVPTMFVTMQLNWQRTRNNLPRVEWLTALGATDQAVEVTRVDDRTVELFTADGYLRDVFSNFWRGPAVPLHPHEITVVHDYTVTVLTVTLDGRPQRVRVRFDRSIDDSRFYFVHWADKQLKPFSFGRLGERQVIHAAPF